MPTAALLFHTLRHLRWEQFVFRLVARFRKLDVAPVPGMAAARWKWPWNGAVYKPASLDARGGFTFLGETHAPQQAGDWNRPQWSKLWLYNLHYFDDLDATDAAQRRDEHRRWMARWIEQNPAPDGDGWEPYPLSLRVVNWIKWLSAEEKVDPAFQASLALQAKVLRQRLEYHLLGNHLFTNAKALVFAGTWFADGAAMEWLSKGLSILDRQIPEQFLPDGGHFELSPMYHGTLLWDLLELLGLAECTGHPELTRRRPVWRDYVARGLSWLRIMCHPDGEIAFFNDAAFGVAPSPAEIFSYAGRYGLAAPDAPAAPSLRHLADSGYVRADWDGAVALIDVARIGPDYLPGHAHADTLSFEWSLAGRRVFVNSGTSQYGNDAERQRQRGTLAHNTVAVAGENSSEVWAGFRVARRAVPIGLSVIEGAQGAEIACAHDGYRRLPQSPLHRRVWTCRAREMHIVDSLSARAQESVARFHLHPDIRAEMASSEIRLTLASGEAVTMKFDGGTPALLPGTWHPRFGESVATTIIAVPFTAASLVTAVTW
jgi:uncharacterized heparinase superfamily protein